MRKLINVCALLLVVAMPLPAFSAEQPREVIVHFYDGLLAIMKQGKQLGFKGRYDAMAPLVDAAFDMPEMSRLSLGYAAKNLTPEQLAELTRVFRRYTIASYAANFNDYGGERFDVGTPRTGENGSMVVPSQLTPGDKPEPIELDYVMRQEAGRWGIADVLAEGSISEVARRRSEFVSVLRRDGFDGLVKLISAKADALAAKE